MTELFDKIFWEVGDENGKTDWWDIFDTDLFQVVCERIGHELGFSSLGKYEDWIELLDYEVKGFCDWYSDMCEGL